EDHAGLERLVAARLARSDRRDALRPLVDRKEAADAMAGAMGVIEPDLPQILPGEAVELRAARALREAGGGDRDVALEDAGEAVLHLGRRRTHRDGAGDVGRAVRILAARIDQIERIHLDLAVRLRAHAVMDDGAIGAGAGNRVE